MAGERNTTLADYVVLAISPALVMALVTSLIYFLLEILYNGEYSGRLQWILFFYIFGTVLTSRISMQADIASRAGIYGVILGALTWFALYSFVQYPSDSTMTHLAWLVNLGLILLVWWCVWQLTWDCTYIDEKVGANGQGVLEAAGLEEKPPTESDEGKPRKWKRGIGAWIDRLANYWQKRKENRTPGVWVIYFSLAALPIFGLGQALIPADETGRRQYTFWLMVVYVGSGLGLLLTTSFLGLRNYLRQKNLKMPVSMTGLWLGLGVSLIVVLLLLGAFLPRPEAEYPLVDLSPVGSKEKKASKKSARKDESGKDEGDNKGKDKDGKDSAPGKDARDGNKDKDSGGKDKDKQAGAKDKKDQPAKDKGEKDKKEENKDDADKKGEDQNDASSSSQAPDWLSKVMPILKWVVFGILALVVGFFVIRAGLKFLANFTSWAKNLLDFFARLFGRREGKSRGEKEEVAEARMVPFSAFSNPFEDGRAANMTPRELVNYTMSALEAWARERGFPRRKGETPLEFAQRLSEELPAFEAELLRLVTLHARAEYASGSLPASALPLLEQFWKRLYQVDRKPLSA